MTIHKSKLGLLMVVIYLILLTLAARLLLISYPFKFSGLYLVALTFPWSILISMVLDSMELLDVISVQVKTGLLLIGSVPNIIFIYLIFAKIGAYYSRENSKGK
jgi:hypothetical protein